MIVVCLNIVRYRYEEVVASLLLLLLFVGFVLWEEEGDAGRDRLPRLCEVLVPLGVAFTNVSCRALAVAMVSADTAR